MPATQGKAYKSEPEWRMNEMFWTNSIMSLPLGGEGGRFFALSLVFCPRFVSSAPLSWGICTVMIWSVSWNPLRFGPRPSIFFGVEFSQVHEDMMSSWHPDFLDWYVFRGNVIWYTVFNTDMIKYKVVMIKIRYNMILPNLFFQRMYSYIDI